jgi:hypothetical protein
MSAPYRARVETSTIRLREDGRSTVTTSAGALRIGDPGAHLTVIGRSQARHCTKNHYSIQSINRVRYLRRLRLLLYEDLRVPALPVQVFGLMAVD